MTWPRISFDPIKLFDLHVSDLTLHDPYFARKWLVAAWDELGDDLFIGLLNAPEVVGHYCDVHPERADALREGVARVTPQLPERICQAEARLLAASWPWNLGMARSPAIWDALPWSYWDPSVIYDRVDIRGRIVLDVGAGTGQVTIRCAPFAEIVYALEPVAALRRYIERKMDAAGLRNVRTLSGVLEALPLGDSSVDAAILSNGSFGWNPDDELRELERVTRPGGVILMLAPCNFGNEAMLSKIRSAGGYVPFDFEVPCDGVKPAFVSIRS